MNQNLFAPLALITGTNAISCNSPTLTLSNQSTTKIPPALNPSKPVVASLWTGPSPQETVALQSTYVGYMPGTYTVLVTDLNNGCTAIGTKTVDDARDYPPLKNPAAAPVVLECGAASATMTPDMPVQTGYTYSWTAPSDATLSANGLPVFAGNLLGIYWVSVTTTSNGCVSAGYIEVVRDSLQASFEAEPTSGYAPLAVTFSNTSKSLFNTVNPFTVWQFGNGSTYTTTTAAQTATALFTQAGTYSVTAFVHKGLCGDTAVRVINVELPSTLIVPNIFTPNGDGVNDLFFLRAANLAEVNMRITDRWGHTVYELSARSSNVEWNGKNQAGQDVADGVYMYTLKATGKDGKTYEYNGSITLAR